MVTSELGACEWFVWDLRRSNLIDRGQLDQVVGEFLQANPRAEPPELAEYLVGKKVLSQFQADRLLQGKTQGFVLGPFTLVDALGAGSMGTVYKAQSKTDNNWYAVKVLPRRSMWNVRIARRKVRAFETCRHPTVIPFVDVGTSGGMHYLAWPFVEGEGLDKVIQNESKLSPGLAAHFALQIAEGLEVCHQQGLFHGLLKPSNVMIGPENQVYILDLGIGCLLAETEGESLVDTMSTANSVASGLDCASPESIMDPTNLTPAGDQYSLGCVLYYCVTGQPPFPEGTAAEKMMAHQFKEPTPVRDLNQEVPEALAAVIERLMKKAPEARYPNAAEVVEALRSLAVAPSKAAKAPGRPAARADAPAAAAEPANQPPVPRSAMATMVTMQRPSLSPRGLSAPSGGPRLPTAGALPNRQTIKNTPAPTPVPAAKAPAPEPQPEPEEPQEQQVPGAVDEDEPRSWEERLGPVGITIGALVACALAWFVASRLF
jgi:serine/threonine-protein kinase